MSSAALPISPTRFAAALKDLPLGSLHAKVFELRNALTHLHDSNAQLASFAAPGAADYDAECALALAENEDTMARFEERIAMLRREVEGRGMLWVEGREEGQRENGAPPARVAVDVDVEPGERAARDEMQTAGRRYGGEAAQAQQERTGNGRLTDEELRRMLEERMRQDDRAYGDDGEGGLHL